MWKTTSLLEGKLLVVCLGLLLGGFSPGAQAQKTAPPKTVEKKNVLVLSLKRSGSIDENTAKLFDEVLAVELAEHKAFLNTMTGSDVKRILELEITKTAAGCDDTTCMTEIAEALGARYVINGRVGELGEQKIMTLSLFDTEANASLERIQIQDENLEGLTTQMKTSLVKLIAPITPVSVDLSKASYAAPLWTTSFIVAGVATVVIGAAVDVLPESSKNETYDALDVLGPVLYVAGAAIALGGVLFNPFGGE